MKRDWILRQIARAQKNEEVRMELLLEGPLLFAKEQYGGMGWSSTVPDQCGVSEGAFYGGRGKTLFPNRVVPSYIR